jgi:hypothetical protein
MIVEERQYTIQVGRVKEWLDFYEANGFAVQQKYLGKCIGFFVTEIGTLNQVVHLWAYDDLAHRETARATMAKDPAWHAYLSGQPKGAIVTQDIRIMIPTSFSPLK